MIGELESSVQRLVGALESHLDLVGEGAKIDADDTMNRFTLDAALGCLYKQNNVINMNLGQECAVIKVLAHGYTQVQENPVFKLGLIVPSIRKIADYFTLNFFPLGKWRRKVWQIVEHSARNRLKLIREHKMALEENGECLEGDNLKLRDGIQSEASLTDYIVDQFYAGKISRSELINSSVFLLGAGHKTPSDMLAFTLYQLARNQHVQDKVRASIREQGADSEYLDWVINESLRLSPPVASGPSRALSAELELAQFPGVVLPVGTFVHIPVYTIHRMPKYWGADANEFWPERWALRADFHPCQFMPFGAGLRACLGKEFALFEIRLLLSSLLSRFRFDCPEPKSDLNEFSAPLTVFIVHKTPIELFVSRVDRN